MAEPADIAVAPPEALVARPRLLGALAAALPVRFRAVERAADAGDADGLIAFGEPAGGELAVGVPALVLDGVAVRGAPGSVTFTAANRLDARLRGRTLGERDPAPQALREPVQGEVLATRGPAPVWVAQDGPGGALRWRACAPPVELAAQERLKDRLAAGSFGQLLPLVEFLRTVSAPRAWKPPPLRAQVMFDDPNLRWPSYGYIDYRQLLEHARAHGYHAAMAMIPMDSAPVHPGAARLFREHPSHLSLLMHGLRHLKAELMQPVPAPERERQVARALRRIEACERRSGVAISRVVAAPHGKASVGYLDTLLRFGIEALFADSPQPWEAADKPPDPVLAFWHPVNFLAGSMPVIPRYPFIDDLDELVLRAYLDHPLVLYGHHDDLAGGLGPLERAVELVNSLGEVRWSPAAAMARQSVLTRREGDVLEVRPLARLVEVEAGPSPCEVRLDLSLLDGGLADQEVVLTGASGARVLAASDGLTAETAGGRLTVEVRPRRRLDAHTVPAARPSAWPLVRRGLTEGRDRLRPRLG